MKNNITTRLAALVCALALSVSVLCGCADTSRGQVERTVFLFDTIVTIKLRSDGDADALLNGCFDLCREYHRLFDRYDSASDVSRINTSNGTLCEVNEDTAELLEMSLDYARLSDGRFDVTCGRVTRLWDFASDSPSVPEPAALNEALATVGWESLVIDGTGVIVPTGTEIDLGGIAKGYIADKLTVYLRENGVSEAVINLGGNISVIGDKGGQPFLVGIQSPFDDSATIGYLSVSDCSVVTAGSYQRCFESDGLLYHHILDLSDGMPSQSGLASVTVICDSSARADAMATICFLLGARDGLELVNASEGLEAVFITENGELLFSAGAQSIYTPFE